MKLKTFKFLAPIISTVVILTTMVIVLLLIPKSSSTKDTDTHNFVEGTVVNKEIIQGYAGYYYYYPTEYQLVAKYYIDNKEYTYTHYVSVEIYNSYEIGSKIKMCITHEKISDYEQYQ